MSGRGWATVVVAIVAVASLVGYLTVGCTPDDRVGGTFDTTVDPDDCGLDALDAADEPVTITFWHTLIRSNAEWLEARTEEFNASQDQVRVELAQQPNYQDAFTKYKAGLQSGDLPDLVQMEETTVQQMIDSRSTIPAQACLDASGYDTSAFVPQALAYYSSGGVQRSMPWAVSSPVLFYNKAAFADAGLDPEDPPQTFEEVREASQALVDAGVTDHGITLKIASYIYEFLLAKSGGEFVNHGNGRDERATEAEFTSDTSLALLDWWNGMVDDGLALNTGADLNNIDHLLALTNGGAAMTIEASSAIGPVEAVLASGDFGDLEVATAPLPALQPGGGVPVGDGSLWIPRASSPEKRAAAWRFTEFLLTPESQAGLAVAGGYVPVRTDATEVPELVQHWEAKPAYRVAYDQLVDGPLDTSTVGSLIGDYQAVRDAIRDGIIRMLRNGDDPEKAAADAKAQADILMQEYNDRVGA
ncbi:MAG: ABC transporter substrate-binding protein [Acidimicrobiales bacterium]|nr:ABC transporter substrate-binding protein [Acidimicrobiales bacterium]